MPLASSYSYPLLGAFWTIFEIFLWVIWFWILITIFIDIFRSPRAVLRASRSELEASGLGAAVAQSLASGCAFEDAASQQQKPLM